MDMNNCYISHQKQYRPGHNRKISLKYTQERRKEGREKRNIKKINLTSSKSKHSACLKKILQYEATSKRVGENRYISNNDISGMCGENLQLPI